ncbi:serine/threonine-protein kinase [Novipirellula caenicola]|uniref:serine/threonine-protein kinase n=1 Tax=Novipirellula caenicola TaxID=1536901 RepID=UPI0031E5464F
MPSLDELISDFLARVDGGDSVSPIEFVEDYPELRDSFLHFITQHSPPAHKGDKQHTLSNPATDRAAMPDSEGASGGGFERIGRYRLLRVLGSGGMSVVYEAICDGASEPVALKVLHASVASDRGMRQRFQREAETIRSLDHPHIIPLCDFGTAGETSFLAMRLIDGETLAQRIRRFQPAPDQQDATAVTAADGSAITQVPSLRDGDDTDFDCSADTVDTIERATMPEIAASIADVADALQHAHSRGIVHRDVKPSNLMIDSQGKIWLNDFGLASAGEAQTVVTRTGQIIGTPHYMSPEQAAGAVDQIDFRSDIYSLGATLYEWATLHRPYDGDRFRVLLEISSGRLRRPSQICSTVPPPLEAIILKAMACSPGDRYASAAEMADDLRRFASGRHVIARRPGFADHAMRWLARNPRISISAALGVAAAVLLVMLVQYMVGQRLAIVNTRLQSTNDALQQSNTELAQANRDLDHSQSRLRRHLYVADMGSAYQAYAQQDLDAVNSLLERHDPEVASEQSSGSDAAGLPTLLTDPVDDDQRGFEWWLLKNLSRPPEVLSMTGHEAAATEAAVIPGQNRLLSVGEDGWARHWDLASGHQLDRWEVGGQLNAVAVSPDATLWITGINIPIGLNWVGLGDFATGDVRALLPGHQYSVESAAFSPDGKWIATAGRYHEVFLYESSGRFRGRVLTGSRNEALHFSADSKRLLAVRREQIDGEPQQVVTSYTLPDLLPTIQWKFSFSPYVFALSANGDRCVAADGAEWAVLDLGDPKPIANRKDVRGRIRCVAIAPSGDRVALGCDNGLLHLWNVDRDDFDTDPRSHRVITTGTKRVTSVGFHGEEKLFVSSEDGSVQLWSLHETKVEHPSFGVSTQAVSERSADADCLFLRGDHGGVERLDLATLTHEQIGHVNPDEYCCVAATSDGKTLAASTLGGIVILSADDGSEHARIEFPQDDVSNCVSLRFVQDDQRLLVLFSDRIRQYRISDGAMTREQMLRADGAQQMLVSPDRSTVMVVCRDVLQWCGSEDLQWQATYPRQFGQYARCCYSEDGQMIASGYQDGTIELLRVSSLESWRVLRGHRHSALGLQFIDDDRTLVSSSRDGTIRFWDVDSGREIGVLDAGEVGTHYLHFSEPTQRLFSLGPHRPIKVWSGDRVE